MIQSYCFFHFEAQASSNQWKADKKRRLLGKVWKSCPGVGSPYGGNLLGAHHPRANKAHRMIVMIIIIDHNDDDVQQSHRHCNLQLKDIMFWRAASTVCSKQSRQEMFPPYGEPTQAMMLVLIIVIIAIIISTAKIISMTSLRQTRPLATSAQGEGRSTVCRALNG